MYLVFLLVLAASPGGRRPEGLAANTGSAAGQRGQTQVAIPEAHPRAPIQPPLDLHPRSAQSGRKVNLETRVLIVGESKTKAGSGRCVPLNQPAWAALDMWTARFPNWRADHYVFPACENGKIHPTKPVSHWRTA